MVCWFRERWCLPTVCAIGGLWVAACSSMTGGLDPGDQQTTDVDAGAGGWTSTEDGGIEPDPSGPPPEQYVPCEAGDCWSPPPLVGLCGTCDFEEDFSSGNYNVHEVPFWVPADTPIELTLAATGGSWNPALIIRDEEGAIYHDGELSLSDDVLAVELITTGQDSDSAALRLTAQQDLQLYVFVTGWHVVQSGFVEPMPTEATYQLNVFGDCEAPPGDLLSPPNFDPNDQVDGYFLLPESMPPGLYTKKDDDCSRGTKTLIDVLYTVAWHWHGLQPTLSPITILDLNEAWCSTVDHATHDDGTHADIKAGCATEVACIDNEPAIQLAKLFVDTGEACGIINNDPDVQAVVNAYFESKFSYTPWHSTFMRSVDGHTHHFHIRVKKPDGTCSPY